MCTPFMEDSIISSFTTHFIVKSLPNVATFCHTGYLRGRSTTDECQDLFQKYKTCLNVGATLRLAVLFQLPIPPLSFYSR